MMHGRIQFLLVPLVDGVFMVVQGLLALRVLLKLFGARTGAPFVRWVYDTTSPLLAPFSGMFPSPVVDGGHVIEFSTLFALIMYGFVAYALYGLAVNVMRISSDRML